jgi:hypothetical protein
MGTNGVATEQKIADLVRETLKKGLERMAEGDTLVIIDEEENAVSVYRQKFDEGPGCGAELSVHYRRVDQMSLDLFN